MDILKTRIELYDELLKAARGEIVIDTVIESGNIVNVLTGEIQQGNLGIHKGFIVSLFNNNIEAQNTINAARKTIIPSYIDPHIHIESSMILPTTYAEVVALNGTGTIFADPHEIVNVMGVDGFKLMLQNSKNLPARIFFDVPTCVPAKRIAESSGADIRANDIREMINQGGKKLGELMSVEEIISGDPIMGDIIKTGWEEGIPRDAHFHWLLPSLAQTFTSLGLGAKLKLFSGFIGGKILRINRLYDLSVNVLVNRLRNLDNSSLDTYLVALGLTADHENYGPELQIKLDHGMRLLLSSHIFSFPEMVPLLLRTVRRQRYKDTIGMCTDDLWPDDLIKEGGMLGFVKALIKHGLDPIDVIRFTTLNNAQRLAQSGIIEANLLGSIVPGQIADITILDGPLKKMNIDTVIHEGQIVAKNGELMKTSPSPEIPAAAMETVKVPEISEETFQIPAPSNLKDGVVKTRVLSLPKPPALPFPNIIDEDISIEGSFLDIEGYTTITVINRYKDNVQPSRGIIRGYSIDNGALASTVAHDSHNFIVLGSNVSDMIIVAKKVVKMNGGLVASQNGKILANIALPVGGLMSTAPIEELCKSAEQFRNALDNLGLDPSNPIMPFALFSLPAVPGAKLTDLGLWDDKQKKIVPIYV
ncbi:MAG: adenine deaminase C-terminal domain-containing protein [Candidatus Thorarchaeota archaeon]